MQDDIAAIIKSATDHARKRDFLLISAAASVIFLASILFDALGANLAVLCWSIFMIALFTIYRFAPQGGRQAALAGALNTKLNAQRAELENLRVLKGVAEALPEPFFILDDEGVVQFANAAASELVGASEIKGRHFAAVLRAPDVYDATETVAKTGEPAIVDFSTSGSVERYCRAVVIALQGAAGEPAAPDRQALVFVRDLTSEHRLEQMRADFIASASHELRTPLASLLGFIETLRGPAKTDEEAREKFLGIMEAQALRMQRLVADLMSLSRIELNEHVPPHDDVDLGDVAKDVLESLSPLFEQAGAIVDLATANDASMRIRGDRDEIFQAVQNLLDNAVKYGGDPAMIKLRVGRGVAPPLSKDGEVGVRAGDSAAQIASRHNVQPEDLIFIQIRDFGPGIERAALPRLTERFYRVNIERSRKSGGTGLGLAIVKHIINHHQGGFQIESKLAVGTAFNCYFLSDG